jgi:hypothetical protein
MEDIFQPRPGKLRRNHSHKDQCRVELGIDDPGVEGDAPQNDARTAARICRQREIDEVKVVEARQPAGK